MKYTVLIYETPGEFAARSDAKRKDAYWGAYRAYTRALTEAGIMIGGSALQPADAATTVRQRDGKRRVQDGPYAESKEQLGGYYVIEARDLNDALRIASRIPGAKYGCVEVRPVAEDAQTLAALGKVAAVAAG
jgi:hypothetical protein